MTGKVSFILMFRDIGQERLRVGDAEIRCGLRVHDQIQRADGKPAHGAHGGPQILRGITLKA